VAEKSVLFVDDEPQVLHGLERMLRSMRHEWRMVFCTSAADALEQLGRGPFDVIVTDMRMPEIDGASLLRTVAERHPSVLRLVLSGQAEQDLLVRAASCAHQLLSKPFEAQQLKAKLEQTLALRELLTDGPLCALVARLGGLPSLPSLYSDIVAELGSSYPSTDRVGAIVARDMAMTAKLLQLVNSAMFGVQRQISDPVQAVRFLGLETIKTLALSAQVFSSFDGRRLPGVDAGALWAHSLAVSERARALAALERCDATAVAEALSGGLLHDVGKLVLADGLREEYECVVKQSRISERPLFEVEQEVLGTTHAHVGAYLLGIWGLPRGIVTSVGAHHTGCAGETKFGPVAAVWIANSLVTTGGRALPAAEEAWLQGLGLGDWRTRWTSVLGEA
jgi:putative nucleotidyltransferase with HDIG domain